MKKETFQRRLQIHDLEEIAREHDITHESGKKDLAALEEKHAKLVHAYRQKEIQGKATPKDLENANKLRFLIRALEDHLSFEE